MTPDDATDESRRFKSALTGMLGIATRSGQLARAGFSSVLAKARSMVDELLQKVFGDYFEVPDEEHAVELLSQDVPSNAASSFVVSTAAAKTLPKLITRLATRAPWLARVGGPATAAVATGATMAAGPAQAGVRRVLWDLRVLSSFMVSKARAEGIELERPVLQAASVAALADHRRRIDHRYAGAKASAVVVRAMTREAAGKMSQGERRELARARIERLSALDLGSYQDEWREGRGGQDAAVEDD
ncbi:MAG: hypothetical protein FJW86_12795 [Actinobacteria bacterium]|nr:hypothetical protein [Actinomycetota bacterium]